MNDIPKPLFEQPDEAMSATTENDRIWMRRILGLAAILGSVFLILVISGTLEDLIYPPHIHNGVSGRIVHVQSWFDHGLRIIHLDSSKRKFVMHDVVVAKLRYLDSIYMERDTLWRVRGNEQIVLLVRPPDTTSLRVRW